MEGKFRWETCWGLWFIINDGHKWWRKEDDHSDEGILLQLSLPVVFVSLSAQLSREAPIFMMLKTDRKIWNTGQRSDQKTPQKTDKRRQLSPEMWRCLYLKPSSALVFLLLLSQQTAYRGEGRPSQQLELRLRSRTQQQRAFLPGLPCFFSKNQDRLPQAGSLRSILPLSWRRMHRKRTSTSQ